MTDQVQAMVREGRISQKEYDIFLLFEGNDLGRRFLQEKILETFMEEPENIGTKESFVHYAGRCSVWRKIREVINSIHKEMEVYRHDRDSGRNGRDYLNT